MNWIYLVPNHKTYCDKRFYKNYYVTYLQKLGYKCADTGDCFANYPAAVIYEKQMKVDDGLNYNAGDIIYFMTRTELKGFDTAGIEYWIIPESSPKDMPRTTSKPKYSDFSIFQTDDSNKFKIKKVIFNDPATIVFWEDGTKTVVKCQYAGANQHGKYREKYDKEKGLAMCFAKKALGNTGGYNDTFHEWIYQ